MVGTKEKLEALNARFGDLYKVERQTMTAFKALSDAASRTGKISPAIKEMTAVVVAAVKGCEDCIVYHAAAAKKQGASREEFAEMLAVAIEMGGGPGAVYAAKAIEAWDDLN